MAGQRGMVVARQTPSQYHPAIPSAPSVLSVRTYTPAQVSTPSKASEDLRRTVHSGKVTPETQRACKEFSQRVRW